MIYNKIVLDWSDILIDYLYKDVYKLMNRRDRENIRLITQMNFFEQNKHFIDPKLKMIIDQLDYDIEEDLNFEFDVLERFTKEELKEMDLSDLKQIQRRFQIDLTKLKKLNFDLSQFIIMIDPKYKNN